MTNQDVLPCLSDMYRTDWDQNPIEAVHVCQTITEVMHQSYEGWTDAEQSTIKAFLNDLALAVRNGK